MPTPTRQVVWVYRAVNVLAEQVANIPFLFSAGDRGRETLITSGPLLDFYNHPRPNINRFQYWELRIMWLMLRGECFRVPIYDDSSSSSLAAPKSDVGGSRITHHASPLKSVVFLDPAHLLAAKEQVVTDAHAGALSTHTEYTATLQRLTPSG